MNTQLMARLTVDGTGDVSVDTGLPTLDHLLGVLARYGRFDLVLEIAPDSPQAQIESTGRALGEALYVALASPARAAMRSAPFPRAKRLHRSRWTWRTSRWPSRTSTSRVSMSQGSAGT